MHEEQYQFVQCVKENDKQNIDSNDGDILYSMPLPKLTLKSAKGLANLCDLYMPSKTLLNSAHVLLKNHKCEICPDLPAIFKPYKATSNAGYEQTWYQNNREKHPEYNEQCTLNFEY